MKRFFSFFCLLQISLTSLHAQLTSAEIDALVQKAMTRFNVAGVAVAVVKDGKIVHEKGYGVRSITTKQPINAQTNFQIASNSKAFTTAAIAILIDEGKLSWKDKVKTYIPEFKMYNEYVTEHFLVEDLLCHRSGLGLGAGDLMIFPDGADFKMIDVLTNFQHFKPVSEFRTKWDYDNQLYIVAGELIARVSGMSWEKFVQTKIMDPLKMDHSSPSLKGLKDTINIATPHSTGKGAIRTISFFEDQLVGSAGGILSNVDDMSKWMMVQLNKGKYGSPEQSLFSENNQREMWQIHSVLPVNKNPRYNSHFNGYGLGWDLSDIKGNLNARHTGGLPGMLTSVSLIPDLKLGIVILTNTESGGGGLFTAVGRTIQDSYLGLDDFGWVEKIAKEDESWSSNADSVTKKVWATVAANKKTIINPNDYVGTYEDKWFGKVEISLRDKQLFFRSLRSPKLNGAMQFYKANSFAIQWEYQDMNGDALAMFSLDENGKAQSIKMKGISPEIDFSFDFQDLFLERIK